MTSTAIAMVLVSALLHAAWNFFNKDSRDRWAFFVAQGMLTVVLYTPLTFWFWRPGAVDASGWFWIAGSAVTHFGYAFYLLKAYDVGDLSVAYPLSRTAPVLLAAWDMTMTRGQVTALGVTGALLSGAGALTLQVPAMRSRGVRAVMGDHVMRYALTTALFIAVFTLIDKQGVARVHPFLFLYFTAIGEFALISRTLGHDGKARVLGELRSNWKAVLFVGILGPFSYLLILWVLASAPASYVLGLRQSSIVFGVLLGRFLLGEGETRYRLIGAVIIACGSVLIAAAG